jgi:guanylate kinase
MSGKLIIISAPSGAGKTTIIKEVMQSGLDLEFSVSACSRSKRSGEVDGKDYYFLSVDDFKKKIKNGEFLEWEEVYKDHFYGTLRSELQRIWNNGKYVLIETDVYGGINIKDQFGKNALSLFIMPPSIKHLEKRLLNRSTDKIESIRTRVAKAKEEILLADNFDKVIVNDKLDKAINESINTIVEFLRK